MNYAFFVAAFVAHNIEIAANKDILGQKKITPNLLFIAEVVRQCWFASHEQPQDTRIDRLRRTIRESDIRRLSKPTHIVFNLTPCNLPLFLRDELNLDQAANCVAHV